MVGIHSANIWALSDMPGTELGAGYISEQNTRINETYILVE